MLILHLFVFFKFQGEISITGDDEAGQVCV